MSRSLPRGEPFTPKRSFGKQAGLNPTARVALHFHYTDQPSRTSFRPPVFHSLLSHTQNGCWLHSGPDSQLHSISGPHFPFTALYYKLFLKLIDPSKSKSKPKLADLPADSYLGTSARPGQVSVFHSLDFTCKSLQKYRTALHLCPDRLLPGFLFLFLTVFSFSFRKFIGFQIDSKPIKSNYSLSPSQFNPE